MNLPPSRSEFFTSPELHVFQPMPYDSVKFADQVSLDALSSHIPVSCNLCSGAVIGMIAARPITKLVRQNWHGSAIPIN